MAAHIGIFHVRALRSGIVEYDGLPRPNDGVQDCLGKIGCRDSFAAKTNRDGVAYGRGLRLELLQPVVLGDQEPALRARMLERSSHEPVDQLFQDDLAGNRLRDLDDGAKVEVFDGRTDRGGRTRRPWLLPEVGKGGFELPNLAHGSPPHIAVARGPQIRLSDRREVARRIEAGGKLVSQRLVLHEAILARRLDGLFIEPHGVEVPPLEAGNFGRHEGRAIRESRATVRGPSRDLLVMREQRRKVMRAQFGGRRITTGCSRESGVEMVFGGLKEAGRCPQEAFGLLCRLDCRPGIPRKEARLELSDPVPAREYRRSGLQRLLELNLFGFGDRTDCPSPQRPNEAQLRGDEFKPEAIARLLGERSGALCLAFDLFEGTRGSEEVGSQVHAAEDLEEEVAGVMRRIGGPPYQPPGVAEMAHSRSDVASEHRVNAMFDAIQLALFHQVERQLAETIARLIIAEMRPQNGAEVCVGNA